MRTREAQQLDEDLGVAMRAFHGSAEDRRIWASIAWRVGVEAFHFALMDKLAEDAADGTRSRCARSTNGAAARTTRGGSRSHGDASLATSRNS